MDEHLKFGIIVPVYKIPYDMLRECYSSLASQSYHNIEICFVDDASPDNCGAICDEFSRQDNRVKVIHQPVNQGVSAARNIAIQQIDCDYITFVDADDWVDQDYVLNVAKWLETNGTDYELVICRQMMNYEDASVSLDNIETEKRCETRADIEQLQIMAISSAIKDVPTSAASIDNVAAKYISRKVLHEHSVLFRDIPYREDGLFFQEVCEWVNKVAVLPVGFYHYRARTDSAVNQYRPKAPEEMSRLVIYMVDFAKHYSKGTLYTQRLNVFKLIPVQMAISTFFYNPSNPVKGIRRHKQCVAYLKTEPFADMQKGIRLNELKRNAVVKVVLLRLHLYKAIYILRHIINQR